MSNILSEPPLTHVQPAANVHSPNLDSAAESPWASLPEGLRVDEAHTTPAAALYTRAGEYEWVRNHLYKLPRDCSGATKTENLALIREVGRPENISSILRHVLSDPSLLKEIAGRSYHHTNHFDKIVLMDTDNQLGYRLTLHMWTPPYSEFEVNDEQIHDHRFSFWSNILVGSITFQNYVRDASGVMFKEYQYIPERLGVATVGNYYIDVGQSPLLEVEQSGGKAGESYHLTYNRIHRVVLPRTEMSCTLVLRGPRQKNYASVFSNSQKYDPTGNAMFSTESLAGKLSKLLDELEEKMGERS